MTIMVYSDTDTSFPGKDGKQHMPIYTIERKLFGNAQLCGARINGEWRSIDFSLPTEVQKIPRKAKRLSDELAEKVWNYQGYSAYDALMQA